MVFIFDRLPANAEIHIEVQASCPVLTSTRRAPESYTTELGADCPAEKWIVGQHPATALDCHLDA